jgi:hypothetical protein
MFSSSVLFGFTVLLGFTSGHMCDPRAYLSVYFSFLVDTVNYTATLKANMVEEYACMNLIAGECGELRFTFTC